MDIVKTSADGRMRMRMEVDDSAEEPFDDLVFHFEADRAGTGPLTHAWDRFRYSPNYARRVDMFARYVRMTGGHAYVYSPERGPYRVFYLPAEHVADVRDPAAYLKSVATEYEAWATGDVHGYIIEAAVTWSSPGRPDMTTWEEIDSCWGFFGWVYALTCAGEAWEAHTAP